MKPEEPMSTIPAVNEQSTTAPSMLSVIPRYISEKKPVDYVIFAGALFGAYTLGKYGSTKGGWAVTAGYGLSGLLIGGTLTDIALIKLDATDKNDWSYGIGALFFGASGLGLLGLTFLGNYIFGSGRKK